MIKIVAIDDDVKAIRSIESFCKSAEGITLEKAFTNLKDGLKYLNKFPIDVVLLSADMFCIKGVELSKQLKQDTCIVLTISAEKTGEAKPLSGTMDYLQKPFAEECLRDMMKKISARIEEQKENSDIDNENHFFVRADFGLIKVSANDIVYIEALGDYVKLHLLNQKTLVVRFTMKTIQQKLSEKKFVRIHRSFIVSKNKVEQIYKKAVMIDGKELPLGLKYEKQVGEQMPKFFS